MNKIFSLTIQLASCNLPSFGRMNGAICLQRNVCTGTGSPRSCIPSSTGVLFRTGVAWAHLLTLMDISMVCGHFEDTNAQNQSVSLHLSLLEHFRICLEFTFDDLLINYSRLMCLAMLNDVSVIYISELKAEKIILFIRSLCELVDFLNIPNFSILPKKYQQ